MRNSVTFFLMIVSFLTGALCMHLWEGARPSYAPAQGAADEPVESASLLTVDLKDGQLPEGIYEAEQAQNVQSESEMPPSQLATVKIEGFESVYVPEEKQPQDAVQAMLPPRPAEPVTLVTTSTVVNVLPTARVVVEDDEESAVTLIQLPVSVQTIKTQDEYKKFKRTARGKYPDVDFQKEMVIVLLSASDMPDNMLEIVKVTPLDDKLEVSYRVNVFGLDQKTNTHSVAATEKSKKEIVLKQVR